MKRFLFLTTLILAFSWASPVYAYLPPDEQMAEEQWRIECQTLNDWQSLDELKLFLALKQNIPLVMRTDNTGSFKFDNNQCEDYAFTIRDEAEKWGRRLETEILTPSEYRQYYGKSLPPNTYHAINKAVIGNEWWLVDWKESKVWHYMNLD